MVCGDGKTANEKVGGGDRIKKIGQCPHNGICSRTAFDENLAVCRPRNTAPIAIRADAPVIVVADLGASQALDVIADRQFQSVARKALLGEIDGECIRHLPDNLISSMRADSKPHAWSISSSACTPKRR